MFTVISAGAWSFSAGMMAGGYGVMFTMTF